MSPVTNPLLSQFVEEARSLLEQAGSSLLALERGPANSEDLNALFRAVHTLKGTSGIFEIGALTRTVHALEDLLDQAQAERAELGSETIDLLLAALDQVGDWIDAIGDTGILPSDADTASGEWVRRLRDRESNARSSSMVSASSPVEDAALPSWVAALTPQDLDVFSGRTSGEGAGLRAVTYRPDEHCFYRGEDPLALMRQIGGLRLLRAAPVAPWPSLPELDPFRCNLTFQAIAEASAEELTHLFRYVPDQVEILELPDGWKAGTGPIIVELPSELVDAARQLLADQRRMLAQNGGAELFDGKLAAAAQAVRNILARQGSSELLRELEDSAAGAGVARDPSALIAFIDRLLASLDATPDPVQPGPETIASYQRANVSDAPLPGSAVNETRGTTSAAPAILRVEQSKIDALMNLIGELVVAKNSLAYLARRTEIENLPSRVLARELKERHAALNRIADDMQTAVLAVRTLPVDHVFQRFPRLVRDLARRLNKEVELRIRGGETEADKNVIEALADPLIHIVRNSLDHGLETVGERVEAGKPRTGSLDLEASQEGDDVVIRVRDDGRGIDPAKVKQKAIEKGLLDAERAQELSEEDTINLVFAPGFSTAAAVSDLSGRGVGMDVVRSAVERAGGRVTLTSRNGVGTVVEIRLPLSMAVMRLLTVHCGGRLFGIPMNVVVETVRVPVGAIHRLRNREAFVLRESIVPVVRLAQVLDLPDAAGDDPEVPILVVRFGVDRLGIVVAGFREGIEAIVKPMEGVLADLRGFAGTTLLGDGQVLLVLDLEELVT